MTMILFIYWNAKLRAGRFWFDFLIRSIWKQFSPSFVGEDDDDGGGGQLGVVVDGVAARVAGVGNGSVKRDLQKVIWSHQYKIWGLPTINSVRLGFRQQKSRESKLDTALTKSSIQKTYLVFQLRLNERNSFNKIAEGRRFKYRKVQRLKVSNMLEMLAIYRRLGCLIQTTQNFNFCNLILGSLLVTPRFCSENFHTYEEIP